MAISEKPPTSRYSLSVIAILSFLVAFGAARIFTYLFPGVVVFGSGFHFHHFWYGLLLLAASGWLGIAGSERWTRIGAVTYGIGGGLIGDEVGLLLTFGDYRSSVTYTVVVGVIAFAAVLSLLRRYWIEISTDLKRIAFAERGVYFGLFVLALSLLIGFRGGFIEALLSILALAMGFLILAWGIILHRRR